MEKMEQSVALLPCLYVCRINALTAPPLRFPYKRIRNRLAPIAGDCWVLAGWPVCPVRRLPDGCVLTGGVHVRFPVVSWFQGIRPFPRAEAPAGLHLLLSGGQRGQDSQSGSENSTGKYRGDPGFLPGRGHRHSVPAEFWKPFCPGDRAGRRQASSGC